MSAWVVDPTRPETQADSYEGMLTDDKRGQQWLHRDRSASMAITGGSGSVSRSAARGQEYDNISVRQKMMSATWGSILTSVLGNLNTPLNSDVSALC